MNSLEAEPQRESTSTDEERAASSPGAVLRDWGVVPPRFEFSGAPQRD